MNSFRDPMSKIARPSWALVAHTCNPSYSGGRDQEALGLKPTRANSLQNPISGKKNNNKKTYHTKGLVEWLQV
jgi:hypothetical protein